MSIMRQYEKIVPTGLPRTSSCRSNSSKIIPTNFFRSSAAPSPLNPEDFHHRSIVRRGSTTVATFHRLNYKTRCGLSNLLRSILSMFTFPSIILPAWLNIPNTLSITPCLGRKVTGTLFGNRRGHVSFAVQDDPRSVPVFVIELAVSTASLVKEMSSALVRIALECEKSPPPPHGGGDRSALRLFAEPIWTMYCNGREAGYAQARACTESDWHVLRTVQSVSVGAGVIPVMDDGKGGSAAEGELLYMRARFERVVGSRDSEAFYMLNPDGGGGPELSIFLLRI